MILMVLACAAMVGALFLLVGPTEDSLGNWPWLIVLLCPLLHLFMHRRHGGH